MAISSISGLTTNPFQSQTNQTSFRQTFNQLVSALNSGDLSTAQQAFSALSQLQSNGQGPNSNSPLSKALSQIGQALQSGDPSVVQQALATLQQAHGHHHGHHGHHGGDAPSTSSQIVQGSSSDANGSSSGNAVDVTA